jgi:hypothetical protein
MRASLIAAFLFCLVSTARADDLQNLDSLAQIVEAFTNSLAPGTIQKHEITNNNLQMYVTSMNPKDAQDVAGSVCSLSKNSPDITWTEKHAVEVYLIVGDRPGGLCYVGQ